MVVCLLGFGVVWDLLLLLVAVLLGWFVLNCCLEFASPMCFVGFGELCLLCCALLEFGCCLVAISV